MSYTVTQFGSVTLPPYNGRHPIGGGPVGVEVISLPAGVYDAQGGETSPRRQWRLSVSGEVVSTSAANFRTAINALLALLGTKAKLYRTWDDTTVEWIWARLVSVGGDREPGMILYQALELEFEIFGENWNASSETNSDTDLIGTPQYISLTNSGNAAVKNAVITVTNPAGNGTLTSLTFAAGDAEFVYSGSLAAGSTLVIDTGARSVTLDGVDDYDNFTLTANHAQSEWLKLAAGANTLAVTTEPDGAVLPGDVADLTGYATGLAGAPPTYASGSITATSVVVSVDYYSQWR